MQDRYAHKRHHGVVGEAEDAEKKSSEGPKIKVSVTRPIGHKIADIGPGGKEHNVQTKDWPADEKKEATTTIEKIRERMEKNGIRRPRRIKK